MYITKIKLKNFRCYENEEFLVQEGSVLNKPITIIYGLEGSGKTSLFNAVGWALYGEETERLLNEQKQDLAIPNLNAFSNSSRAEVSVSVDLMFEKDEEISRVKISRRSQYLKGMSDASSSNSEALIFYKNGKTRSIEEDTEKVEFNNFMGKYFPQQLLEFYMFTGEYLKRTYTTKGSNLQRGIMGQFKTGAIINMCNKLGELKEHYSKIARKKSNNHTLDSELKEEQEKKTKLDKRFQELNDTISKLEELVKNEETDIIRYSEEYGRLKEKSEQIKKRDDLSKSLSDKKRQSTDLEVSLYKSILEKGHFLHSKEKLGNALEEIEKEVGKRKLPPDVEAPFVKSLLEEHICICGREIPKDSEEETLLLGILRDREPDLGSEILKYLQSPIKIIQDSLNDWNKGISQLRTNLDDAIKDVKKFTAELESISELEKDLTGSEIEIKTKYESALRRKSEISDELDIEKHKKSRTEREIHEVSERIDEINEKIFQATGKDQEIFDAKDNYVTVDLVQKALKQIPEDLFMSYAERLQIKINYVLKSFNIISQFTAKVSYSDKGLSFAFKELSPEFEEFGVYMSGGQNQLVGICMMASFISVLEDIGRNVVEPPMVFMDHPISNLSESGKALFQEKLIDIFKDIQLIIIATDGEIPGFLARCGKDNISKIYKVENDKARKVTYKAEVN